MNPESHIVVEPLGWRSDWRTGFKKIGEVTPATNKFSALQSTESNCREVLRYDAMKTSNCSNARDARRRALIHLSCLGAGALTPLRAALAASAPTHGQVFVNGQPAAADLRLQPGDEILTGPDSQAIFAIGQDAFLARSLTSVRFDPSPDPSIVQGLRVLTGALMGVFGRGRARTIRTPTVTAGIRGTGVYLEASPQLTYFCTCYGEVDLECSSTKTTLEVRARNHTPHRIHAEALSGRTIVSAPLISHSNDELAMLEALVGRKSPLIS